MVGQRMEGVGRELSGEGREVVATAYCNLVYLSYFQFSGFGDPLYNKGIRSSRPQKTLMCYPNE